MSNATYYKKVYQLKGFPYIEEVPVRVMTTSEGYAMVRRKNATPFVIRLSELEPPKPKKIGKKK